MGCSFSCFSEEKEVYVTYPSSISLARYITKDRSLDEVYSVQDSFKSTSLGITRKASLRSEAFSVYEIRSFYIQNCSDLLQSLTSEISMAKELSHVNIETISHIFETESVLHVAVPGEGQTLSERLEEKSLLTEEETVIIIKQVLQAVSYLHTRGICHRNLNLDSIMIHSGHNGLTVKIGGFGYARRFIQGDKEILIDSMVGSTLFMSPEMINGYYKQECDLWSIGVLTFRMVFGTFPFPGEDTQQVFNRIRSGNFVVPDLRVSSSCIGFIKGLLHLDARKRLPVQEAINHPWMLEALININ